MCENWKHNVVKKQKKTNNFNSKFIEIKTSEDKLYFIANKLKTHLNFFDLIIDLRMSFCFSTNDFLAFPFNLCLSIMKLLFFSFCLLVVLACSFILALRPPNFSRSSRPSITVASLKITNDYNFNVLNSERFYKTVRSWSWIKTFRDKERVYISVYLWKVISILMFWIRKR